MSENADSIILPELTRLTRRLGTAAIVVDESSKILAFTTAATVLFGLEERELEGNFWAGLDAQLTLIMWRRRWREISEQSVYEYETDIATGSDYLRPVRARTSQLSEALVLIELTDLIAESAARLQLEAISQVSNAGYFYYNRIDKELYISPIARELTGLPDFQDRRELVAYVADIMPSAEWERFSATATSILQEIREFEYPFRIENKRGTVSLVARGKSYGNPLHVTHIVGSVQLAEEQTTVKTPGTVTAEMARFSMEEARDMILWTTPDGSLRFANQSAASRLGYSKTRLEKESVRLIAPYFDEVYRDAFWKELREKKSVLTEYHLVDAQGNDIPISAQVNYLRFGGEEYACSFCRDLTFKKKRDAFIELSRAALDFASDYIIWLEEDLTIRYLNRAMLELAGGKLSEWEGVDYSELFENLPQEKLVPNASLEYSIQDRAGRLHYLDLRCDLLEHQQVKYLALVGRDVTERHLKQEKLVSALNQIKELRDRLQHENVALRDDLETSNNINEIITVSPKYRKVLKKISQVADVNTTVLITGETGTGKELLARAIHKMSDRNEAPLIKVNCAALPESLIESELFGHEKGAFTGAINRKKGRFELADGGTLFLDEVGEMPLDLQAKLLRVLQEDEFERLGGTETIRVDVRLIAATNRNLEKMVEKGSFRADLYYRLNVFPIHNLPLRKRRDDIPVLIEYFANKFAKRQGKKIKEINAVDLEKLKSYDFPGNIRELENIVERAVVICTSETLNIPFDERRQKSPKKEGFATFEDMQRKHIIAALKRTGGRVTGPEGAGKLLDLNDRTLMSKMRKLNIHKREYLL